AEDRPGRPRIAGHRPPAVDNPRRRPPPRRRPRADRREKHPRGPAGYRRAVRPALSHSVRATGRVATRLGHRQMGAVWRVTPSLHDRRGGGRRGQRLRPPGGRSPPPERAARSPRRQWWRTRTIGWRRTGGVRTRWRAVAPAPGTRRAADPPTPARATRRTPDRGAPRR